MSLCSIDERSASKSSKRRGELLMTRMMAAMRLLAALLLGITCAQATPRSPPVLPRQFQADLAVVSHLTDPRKSYPPSMREMKIYYDFDQQLARAHVVSGHDAGKTFVRRYDQKREYMVKHGKYAKCERAYLGESMPTPAIPFPQEFVGMESVRGKSCEHWVHAYSNVRVHVYAEEHSKVPIRLTEENFVGDQPTMMLTYDLLNVRVGPQNPSDFAIPDGYAHKNCTRSVGGFPYIHAFHYYLRF